MWVAVLMSNQQITTLLRLFLGTGTLSLSLLTDLCLEGTFVLDLVLDCHLFPLSQFFTSDHSILKHTHTLTLAAWLQCSLKAPLE